MMTDRERNTFEEFAKSLEEDFLKNIVDEINQLEDTIQTFKEECNKYI